MSDPVFSRLLRSIALVFAVVAAGCSPAAVPPNGVALPSSARGDVALETSIAPGALTAAERGLFVDLAIGRVARSERSFRWRVTPTGGEPGPWQEVTGERTRTVQEEIWIAGVPYRIEHDVLVESEGGTSTFDDAWRQDRSGLFLLDTAAGARSFEPSAAPALVLPADQQAHAAAWAAAARTIAARRDALHAVMSARADALAPQAARGGPNADEITFLRYPLHPGASWEGRVGFNVWTVEAREALVTPAGRFPTVRLRIDLPGNFGPNDSALTWWGQPGEVAHAYRIEADATDENGQVIGRIESDEEERLVEYVPAGR